MADSESNSSGRNPGWLRGIRIGSLKDGKVLYRIPDPLELPGTSAAEGVAVDAKGNVYGGEVGPRQLVKHFAERALCLGRTVEPRLWCYQSCGSSAPRRGAGAPVSGMGPCRAGSPPSRLNQRQHLVDHAVRDRFELLRGAVLYRMRHPGDRGIEAERVRLRGGGRLERFRGDRAAGNAAAIEVRDVVQTARRAGASIREADHHDGAALDDLPAPAASGAGLVCVGFSKRST